MRILVTGATGYLGGRLAPRLAGSGHDVRVLVRDAARVRATPWGDSVEIVEGMEVVYYLVHSMSGKDFERVEHGIAERVAAAARDAGVGRIVYLGGLHPELPPEKLSPHLRSRAAVGETLLGSGVPTAVLQAGVVIGSGSASFEMIRHLTEVLPYMPAPKWVRNRIQPIAVRDVLYYLERAAELPGDVSRAFDIGGPDVYRYGQLMNGYALEAGLRQRPIATLPVLTPWLAGEWVNLVTPIPRALAVPLISSLQHDAVCREHDIAEWIADPEGGLTPYRRAVRLALAKEYAGEVETSWQDDPVDGAPSDPLPSDPDWAGHTVYTDTRERTTTAPPEALWRVIEGVGGRNGWYSASLLWRIRGLMDRLVGGIGLRRGRRNPSRLAVGDAVDWWRVEAVEEGRMLRLRAEMRVPGTAWLELRADPAEHGSGSVYRQRAVYFPRGLFGRLYWLGVLPFHALIFPGMAKRITAAAVHAPAESAPRAS